MTKILILLSLALWSQGAVADLQDDVVTNGEFASVVPQEEVAIAPDLIVSTNWQEPIFGNQGNQRGLASLLEEEEIESKEFRGIELLQIQSEIPFTYPWMTHSVLQKRVRYKLLARGKKRKKQ